MAAYTIRRMAINANIPGPFTMNVSKNIRALMARAEVSDAAVSETTGLSQAAVSRLVRGEKNFGLEELAKIANLLGVTPQALMDEAE